MRLLNAIIAGALAALWAAAAWAGPLPDATYSVSISGYFGSTEVDLGGSGVKYANAGNATGITAQLALTPDPTVEVSGGVPFNSGLTALATIDWFVEPIGAAVGDVPIDVVFTDLVTTHQSAPCTVFCPGYNWIGGVSLGHGPEGGYSTEIYQCQQSNYFSCNGGAATEQILVPDNAISFLQIVAGGTIEQGTFTAEIDPTVHIDPAYLQQHPGTTLQISPNVGNGATAPEPASWAMMTVGLALAGAAVRRRRNVSLV